MCGIAGFITGERAKTKRTLIYNVYKEMLALSISRGRDATGIAATMKTGEIAIAKNPTPSPVYVYKELFQDIMSRNPVAVVGHVRAGTKGSRYINANNHPIIAGNIVGVHNGVIHNDNYLTKHFELNRSAEVDSEVVFALLNKLGALDKINIQRVITFLDGAFALAFQHVEHPGQIWLVRGPGRPLVMGHDVRLNTTWFASEARFIVEAYRNIRVSKTGLEIGAMDEGEVVCLDATPFMKKKYEHIGIEKCFSETVPKPKLKSLSPANTTAFWGWN
ncbi:glutamine--fructose-6-phosphate aminotransferase [Peptococcaceae bacterium CEB3]|nr:glutamine--fructose-6-phosphate aminotransferase [Peptococcaceae bacterium CEB3]